MASIVGVIAGHRHHPFKVEPRSVVPGRQRWNIGMVLGRPRVAERLEAGLRETPGVREVSANPVTGRLLVYHDATLSREDMDNLVREAVALAVRETMSIVRSSEPEPSPAQKRARHRRALPLALTASAVGAVGALALTRGTLRFLRSPLVRLGIVLAATVAVVRRAWRKSTRFGLDPEVAGRSIRRPLLQIVGPHKRKLYKAAFCSVTGQILEMGIFLCYARVISLLIKGKSAALVSLGLTSASAQLLFFTGLTTLVALAVSALSFASSKIWRDLAQAVQYDWRNEMYAHIQRVKVRYLGGERTTRIERVLTDDINEFTRFLATSAGYLLELGTSFFVLIPVLLFFAPDIAWIAFLPIPITAWLLFYYQERGAPDYAINSEKGSLLNSQLANNLEASTTVKSFVAEEYEIDRIQRLGEAYRESNQRIDMRTAAYTEIGPVGATACLAGIILFGGRDVMEGTLPYPNFNPLIGMSQLVIWKLPVLGGAIDQYTRTVAALQRVLDLRSLPVESPLAGRSLDVATVDGEIALEGVTFAYPGRPPVLRNLSLRIPSKRTTGIVGGTGAGKTTIAKLLLRFEVPDSGRVLLDGQDIRDAKLRDLRQAIGFVAQDAFLFDGTVGDNIRYGTFAADSGQTANAARLAEAEGFVLAMPSQYDTMVGERGGALSGGQKQRISLARAVLKSAPIVILDEATSAVDNETEAAIQRALAGFARGRTMIIIAHRLSTIRHADWIYVLGDGGVLEGGTHEELLAHDGTYASLWRLQTGER